MTVQRPAFRRTVALQMTGYRDRLARTIKEKREARGLGPGELADKVGVSARTMERWEGGQAVPQRAGRQRLAEVLEIPLESIAPDLPPDQDTLDRIEAKLDRLLLHAGLPIEFEQVSEELEAELSAADPPGATNGSHTGEPGRGSGSR